MVDFEPHTGTEIGKLRPAAVISSNSVGKLPLKIVVPITDWKERYESYPWFVKLERSNRNGLVKHSGADCFQTRSLAVCRFVRKCGSLTADQVDEIVAAVVLCIEN